MADDVVNRPIILDNRTCPYCLVELDSKSSTKEHVVGRCFVPRGKLDQCWNLILRSCKACNNKKSDLEDDLSAISMQADPTGRFHRDDDVLKSEAARKGARSISRSTGKPVANSSTTIKMLGSLSPGLKLTASVVAPPQADEDRAFELARLQMAAFFYLITFEPDRREGHACVGFYSPLLLSIRADWGNPVHIAFMKATNSWIPKLAGMTADGFFRVVIRRHPEFLLWSWGIEWNANLRVIGFLGEGQRIDDACAALPKLEMVTIGTLEGGGIVRARRDVPLADSDDTLFEATFPETGEHAAIPPEASSPRARRPEN